MIDISDEAGELLLARLQQEMVGRPELRRRPIPPGLRLSMGKTGAHLSLGFPGEGDTVVNYRGTPLLIIRAKDLEHLAGASFLVRHRGNEGWLALEREPSSQQALTSL